MRLRAFRVVQKSTADGVNRYPRSIAETGVWRQNGEEHREPPGIQEASRRNPEKLNKPSQHENFWRQVGFEEMSLVLSR